MLKFVLFVCTFAFPRSKSVWVLGSHDGEQFHGNAKYLFLYANHTDLDVTPVWICKRESVAEELTDQGYNAYVADSLKGIYYTLRAKFVFGTHGIDVPWWLTGNATVVQLWHSPAIKTFGWDMESRQDLPVTQSIYYNYVNDWEYFIVTSQQEREKYSSAFRMDPENVWITGYPRTDQLFSKLPGWSIGLNETELEEIESKAETSTMIGYIPTWRAQEDGTKQGEGIEEAFDPARINDVLKSLNAYLVVKLHPKDAETVQYEGQDRIIEFSPNDDVMPLLEHLDVLVTDYSSVYIDYLLLDRPVVFYPYDKESYLESRSLYHDYHTITPGEIAATEDELIDAITAAVDGDGYRDERERIRDQFFEHTDGRSCERVIQKVTSL